MDNTTPGAALQDYEDIDFDPNKNFGGTNLNDINTNVSSPAGFTGIQGKDHLGIRGISSFNKSGIPTGSNQL